MRVCKPTVRRQAEGSVGGILETRSYDQHGGVYRDRSSD